MKRNLYISFLIALIFSSCNLIDPLSDDLENISTDIDQEITYTLTDDDFETIAERAVYLDPSDTVNAEFLEKYLYFTDSVAASKYIPMLLDVKFPGFGSGSSADISYAYNGNVPEELSIYSDALVYKIANSDYQSVGDDVAAAGYFSPLYSPDNYIPGILKTQLDTASSGDIYAIKYKYSGVTPEIDYTVLTINPEYEEGFDDDLSNFSVVSITGDQTWKAVKVNDDGAGYLEGWVNGVYYPNEDWLISPKIDLSGSENTYLQLTHAVEYYDESSLSVLISINYNGDVNTATWREITFPAYAGSNKNKYIESDEVDISLFDGRKINIAFKYVSTSSVAPYWGISNVKIGPYGYKIIGSTPYEKVDFYNYDGSSWEKDKTVYKISSPDYEKMGISNDHVAFTEDNMASDYLPQFVNYNNPYAKIGDEFVIVFDYYNGSEVLTLADLLTKEAEGTWSSTYDYIYLNTDPFASTEGGWVFDPTVVFTMSADDYQIIVDYVRNDPVLSALNSSSYTNTEYYYGATAYYSDFDASVGGYSDNFASWEDAVTEAIGVVLLPNKFTEATTQYKGIDMFYVVMFEVYSAPALNYYIIFQCTKSAPNPEFTLYEGPVAM